MDDFLNKTKSFGEYLIVDSKQIFEHLIGINEVYKTMSVMST